MLKGALCTYILIWKVTHDPEIHNTLTNLEFIPQRSGYLCSLVCSPILTSHWTLISSPVRLIILRNNLTS